MTNFILLYHAYAAAKSLKQWHHLEYVSSGIHQEIKDKLIFQILEAEAKSQ